MDPNEALRQIRLTIKQMRAEDMTPIRESAELFSFIQHARDLATLVDGLDDWLIMDGVLPSDWESEDEKTKPGWVDRVLSNVNEWSDEEFGQAFGFERDESAVLERCTVEHGDWTGPHVRISSCPTVP